MRNFFRALSICVLGSGGNYHIYYPAYGVYDWDAFGYLTYEWFCLSGACQVDVAISTSSRRANLSKVRHLAVATPKLRGCRSSSTVLSQDCLCDTSLWEDPECTTEELGNGLDCDRHD